MKRYLIYFSIAILLVINSCKSPAEPPYPDDSSASAGRRDYTWTADTIKKTFLHFSNIWGNSLNNIWIAGSMLNESLFRYDGQNWNLFNNTNIDDPEAIWGYGNSVWVGNDLGSIWKITGDSYKKELKDFSLDNDITLFLNMAGSSDKDIYLAGCAYENHLSYPILLKYNGVSWSLDKKLSEIGLFGLLKYCPKNDRYYLSSRMDDYSIRIYEYDRKDLKIVYKYPPTNAGPTVSIIDGYAYIVIDNRIYRYFNDRMEFIFEVKEPNFGGVVWGRNRNDIFIRMLDGLAHYNGSDVKYLFKSPEPLMMAPTSAIFEKDIFIPAKFDKSGYSVIYHGTIK